ncbi:MAG TPA: PEP-CTERM sorting domain-containing protein [Roseiarcus sp.]
MFTRIRKGLLVSILAAILGLVATAPASAVVIFQSIPDLTVVPADDLCSQCSSNGQSIGQQFSLATAAVANTATFAVDSAYVWPTSVTVGIYQDLSGSVGSVVYEKTFSSFVSDVPTPNGTDLVTVDIGSVALAPGAYILFMTNPDSLAIAVYGVASGSGGVVFTEGSTDPLTGDTYSHVEVYDAAVSISGVVPEPSTWAMALLGFAGLGLTGYRWSRPDRRNPAVG